MHDRQYLDQDVRFWLNGPRPNFHQFSGWAADFVIARLDSLIRDYQMWERERLTESGLFWQRDVSDGMEESISGGRRVRNLRPTINSYMYGNAKAISVSRTQSDDRLGPDRPPVRQGEGPCKYLRTEC